MHVRCAFNTNHVMPAERYVWHLARCPDKKSREQQKLPIFYCTNNRLHIFLNRNAYLDHMKTCKPKQPKQEKENTPSYSDLFDSGRK